MNDIDSSIGRRAQLGALDLGSNSFHLLVAQESGGRMQVIDKHKEMVRLAAGLDEQGQLSDEARERALSCLERFGQRLRSLDSGNVRVVGTNTLRKAQDPGFMAKAEATLGHRIEIISGREEARLIYLGVCQDLGPSDARRLIVDIGGGSTEVIIGRRFEPESLESLFMGCVSMTRRHFEDGTLSPRRMTNAVNDALVELEPIVTGYRALGWEAAVGTSGTINAVRTVLASCFELEDITLAGLEQLAAHIGTAGTIDKLAANTSGLQQERAPVFPGGVAILLAVFKALGIEHMTTSQSALREGLIFDLMGRQHQDDVRDNTVADLIQRYRIDAAQARQVRETAIALHAQVADAWALTAPEWRLLLGWAADLHEIGMDISHAGYHKHGAYLLENMDMPGFASSEQQHLAALVRSHRRKLAGEYFRGDDDALLRLATLLRIAAVLHRNRSHERMPHVGVRADGTQLTLSLDPEWFARHPLTRLDLANEAAYLAVLGIELTIAGDTAEEKPSMAAG